jgi:hypothetical protein
MHRSCQRLKRLLMICGLMTMSGCTLRLSLDDPPGGRATPVAGGAVTQSVTRLTVLLQSSDPQVRAIAAVELGSMGPKAHDATGELAKLMGDPDRHVRFTAARALAQIDPEDRATVPTLVLVIDDPQTPPEDRKAAIVQLGDMGMIAASARPVIARLQHSDDPDVRDAALVSVGKIDAAMAAQRPIMPATQPATRAVDRKDTTITSGRSAAYVAIPAPASEEPKPDMRTGNIQHYSPEQFRALCAWIHRQVDLTPAQQQANIDRFDEWNRQQEQKITALRAGPAAAPSSSAR